MLIVASDLHTRYQTEHTLAGDQLSPPTEVNGRRAAPCAREKFRSAVGPHRLSISFASFTFAPEKFLRTEAFPRLDTAV